MTLKNCYGHVNMFMIRESADVRNLSSFTKIFIMEAQVGLLPDPTTFYHSNHSQLVLIPPFSRPLLPLNTLKTPLQAIMRAHVASLGGNVLLVYRVSELVLIDGPQKFQAQILLNISGDAATVIQSTPPPPVQT